MWLALTRIKGLGCISFKKLASHFADPTQALSATAAELSAIEGIDRNVVGAHAEGFNTGSVGVAVLGEYNKNAANPIRKILEVQRENAYTTHTYKHTTMGFIQDIEDMPNQYAYSKVFFDRWYRPEKTTIIVAGDVDPAKVIPLVEKYWGGWKRGTFNADIPQEPEHKGPIYAHVPWTSPTPPWVTVAFHGPSLFDWKDNTSMDVMLDLEFGAGQFDLVICLEVLEHMPLPEREMLMLPMRGQ